MVFQIYFHNSFSFDLERGEKYAFAIQYCPVLVEPEIQ